jgi:hypothetical protein
LEEEEAMEAESSDSGGRGEAAFFGFQADLNTEAAAKVGTGETISLIADITGTFWGSSSVVLSSSVLSADMFTLNSGLSHRLLSFGASNRRRRSDILRMNENLMNSSNVKFKHEPSHFSIVSIII